MERDAYGYKDGDQVGFPMQINTRLLCEMFNLAAEVVAVGVDVHRPPGQIPR